jgi:hypothetical protein
MAKGGRYLSPEKMEKFAELMAAGKRDEALALVASSGGRGSWDKSKKKPEEFIKEPLKNGTIQVIVRTAKGTRCMSRSVEALKRQYVYVNAEEIWPS